MAVAIGNGRQAGGGVPLCPDALIDDGLLDLMILPELDRTARLDVFSHLLREGAAGIRAELVTTRSPWIEFESDDDLNVNLDGEPVLLKRFRVECRQHALPVRLGKSPLLSGCHGHAREPLNSVSQWRPHSVLPPRRSGFSDQLLCSEIDMRDERVA